MRVRFWELVYKTNGNWIMETIIKKLNEFKPDENLLLPIYANRKSLNIPTVSNGKCIHLDNITGRDLFIPQSASKIRQAKNTISVAADKSQLTRLNKKRILGQK